VSLAFDDCSNVYGRCKLLDSFEGLLEQRPIIQDELKKKHIGLVQSYGQKACIIAWNLPLIAGALTWCRGLAERIEIPLVKLNQREKLLREKKLRVSKSEYRRMGSRCEVKCNRWSMDWQFGSDCK